MCLLDLITTFNFKVCRYININLMLISSCANVDVVSEEFLIIIKNTAKLQHILFVDSNCRLKGPKTKVMSV